MPFQRYITSPKIPKVLVGKSRKTNMQLFSDCRAWVVKKTAMEKQMRFFFTMFSTSGVIYILECPICLVIPNFVNIVPSFQICFVMSFIASTKLTVLCSCFSFDQCCNSSSSKAPGSSILARQFFCLDWYYWNQLCSVGVTYIYNLKLGRAWSPKLARIMATLKFMFSVG